jgi:hypothetical protein
MPKTRAQRVRDDDIDFALLPGSPTTRQRAPGGALWFVLYALGGTLYVMLLFVILNHQQAVRPL